MLQALVTTAVAAVVCAVLSCWLVLIGWSLMGDAVSHAVLPGGPRRKKPLRPTLADVAAELDHLVGTDDYVAPEQVDPRHTRGELGPPGPPIKGRSMGRPCLTTAWARC